MLIYTCRSRGNNCACIINDSFHAQVGFRVFEANQLQKQHRCLSSNLLPQAYFAARLYKQKIFISFLVLFRFTLTLKTTIVKLRGIWNRCKRSCDCGRFLPSVLTTKGWRTGVFTDMRPVLWACLGFNMYRHSKTFLQVCMSITTPYTYLPLHH